MGADAAKKSRWGALSCKTHGPVDRKDHISRGASAGKVARWLVYSVPPVTASDKPQILGADELNFQTPPNIAPPPRQSRQLGRSKYREALEHRQNGYQAQEGRQDDHDKNQQDDRGKRVQQAQENQQRQRRRQRRRGCHGLLDAATDCPLGRDTKREEEDKEAQSRGDGS